MGVGELHALFRQTINVGRLNCSRSIGAEVSVAEIIRQDKDDVGRGRTFLRLNGDRKSHSQPRYKRGQEKPLQTPGS